MKNVFVKSNIYIYIYRGHPHFDATNKQKTQISIYWYKYFFIKYHKNYTCFKCEKSKYIAYYLIKNKPIKTCQKNN